MAGPWRAVVPVILVLQLILLAQAKDSCAAQDTTCSDLAAASTARGHDDARSRLGVREDARPADPVTGFVHQHVTEEAKDAPQRPVRAKRPRSMLSWLARLGGFVLLILVVAGFNIWKQKNRARERADRRETKKKFFRKQLESRLGEQIQETEARLEALMTKFTTVTSELGVEPHEAPREPKLRRDYKPIRQRRHMTLLDPNDSD